MNHPAPTKLPSDIALPDLTVQEFLNALAARTPAPGGGSMTALTAALAAAQLRMVIAYTRGKPKFSAFEKILEDYDARLARAGEILCELMQEDKAAFEALNPFMKIPLVQRRADPKYSAVVAAAIGIPQAVGVTAANIVEAAEILRDKVNTMLISDLGVAAGTAMAAVESAEFNVLVNLPLLEDAAAAKSIALSLIELRQKSRQRYRHISETLLNNLSATLLEAADKNVGVRG
ncbi:MAG: cyclodeaminase/cyclohydrolase family protein [Phycisphaerae bacterium]